jgi:CII-binding regulator of phage lambda lysogenization HflD
MTGRCCRSIPVRKERNQYVLSIAQKERKMNIDEVILELKERIQEIEDAKTSLTESQEELRETIAALEMAKEVSQNESTV